LLDRQKKLERELESLKAKAASGATSDLAGQARDVNGIKVLAVRLEGFDAKALRDAMDRLKQQLGDAVIVLAGTDGGKAAWSLASRAAAGKIKAGNCWAMSPVRSTGAARRTWRRAETTVRPGRRAGRAGLDRSRMGCGPGCLLKLMKPRIIVTGGRYPHAGARGTDQATWELRDADPDTGGET
jgi:hypothetical protein